MVLYTHGQIHRNAVSDGSIPQLLVGRKVHLSISCSLFSRFSRSFVQLCAASPLIFNWKKQKYKYKLKIADLCEMDNHTEEEESSDCLVQPIIFAHDTGNKVEQIGIYSSLIGFL